MKTKLNMVPETLGVISTGTTDQDEKICRKRKEQNEDEEEDDEENEHENEDMSNQKKPRVVWSVELHRKFVAAVNQFESESLLQRYHYLYLLPEYNHA